ncbi:MAG: hypothetical protein M3Q70_04110 [bacterium]|nr:hypothetical protein [bacterium]
MADEDEKTEATKEHIAEDTKLPTQKIPEGKMHVKVYAPFKTYFNGVADSLTAVNPTGPFDILPRHKNFMTLMSPCEIIIRNDDKEDKVKITRGIMHVKENEIIVFLDV